MNKIIILIAITSFACSDDDATQYIIPTEITSYVDSFYSEASARNSNPDKTNLIITLDSEAQAITSTEKKGDQWYLKFDKEVFEEMERQGDPLWTIESYLYHELGKIVLNRDIIKTTFPHDSLPKSLMNPYYKREGIKNEKLKGILLDELFKK